MLRLPFRYPESLLIRMINFFAFEPHPLADSAIRIGILSVAMLFLIFPFTFISITICVLHDAIAITLAAFELAGILGATWPTIDPATCHMGVGVVSLVCLTRDTSNPTTTPHYGLLRVEPGFIDLLRFLENFDTFAAGDVRLIYSDLAIVDAIFEF